jgi:arabinogalactan oligomer/maltooligosaccharide transport system permease protein
VTDPRTLRRRFTLGLALGLAVGVGGAWALLRGEQANLREELAMRRGSVTAMALDLLAQRAGGEGEPLRALLAAWQAGQPAGTEVRVVRLSGAQLEASTARVDVGELAAPRRLSRSSPEDKVLFDRGQRLRGAVDGNREGGATKREREVERLPSGGLRLAAPLELDGAVVGLVQVDLPPEPPPGAPGPWRELLGVAVLLGAFALAARVLPPRGWALGLVAAALLLAGVGGLGASEVGRLEQGDRAAQRELSRHAGEVKAGAERLLAAQGLAAGPGLDAGRWDVDQLRRPRGLIGAAGQLDEAQAAAEVKKARGDATGALLAAALLGLLALGLVGSGLVFRFGRALVVHRQAYRYIAPAMLGTTVLVFFPFIYGIALSFTSSNIYNTGAPLSELWVGLRNYWTILSDFGIARRGADGALVWNYLNFYWTFLFTVIWTVTNVTFGVSFGLVLALVLNTKGLAFRPIYRVLLILPWAMPNYITALIWKGMFHRQFGVVNQVLAMVGVEPISWFDAPFTSYLTAFATNAWLSFPFMMVVSLGALQSIPADLYEAARVDGATRWQQFTAITLPSLKPALVPAVILSVVWTFNMFNIIYLVSAGAPNGATEILITQAYKFAFEKYQYGYAAAYATIIFGILLVYGNIQNRVTKATEGV